RASPVRETLRFTLTAIACSLVGATVGEGTLCWLGLVPRPELFFGWMTWWLGDACGMLVVTPGLLLLADPRLRDDRLTLQAFPLMCLGLGLTAFSTFAVGLVDRDAHIERFRADTGRLAMTLQGHVELALRDLEALQHAFYKADLDRDEFHALCAPLLARSPWQSTFEWLPRVAAADRDPFETSPSGLGGISIREVDPSGAVVRAGSRAEYFPVAWTEPEAGRETLRGLDHAADAERGTALARARGTGATTSSPPLSTIAYSPDERVVQTLYIAVGGTGERLGEPFEPARVRGLVAATMDLASMLQASIAQMGTSDATALLYDPDAPHAASLLWRGGGAVETVVPVERDRLLAAMTGGVSQRLWIRVGDRRWGLAAQPTWASTMPHPSWLQGAVLCSGLAFTGLLTAFLVVRRRRDEALESARDQLEQQVRARTQDLAATNGRLLEEIAGHRRTEQLLQDARRNAEAANRAKSQFLANMSHEIRTPLNAVLGYTQLLIEDKRQPSDSRERLRIIHGAGQRLLGLINDVLDLAKIEAGGLQVHVEPIDLRRELEEIGTLVAPRVQAKGLALRVDIDLDSDAAVLADRAKFGQIVLNLLGNALKFTDAGTIALRAWRSGGDTIVEVEDTGPGMDAQELASVFTAFRQGAAGVDKGGTGLGLNLSRHLATALGGELSITSTPGRGTRVCLRLPMAEAGVAAVA
ncbi:MAG TPA: ATP-binding protein, partial [Burkholderiaceae bacterium]